MALSPLNGSRDKTRSKFCCLVSIPVLADWFVIMTFAVCWFSVHGVFRRPAEPAEALPADGSYAVGCRGWSNSSRCLRSAFSTDQTVQSYGILLQYLVGIPLIA